ncbi:DnaJ sub C member 30, mitochondrial, partial [Coemansia spiralis]
RVAHRTSHYTMLGITPAATASEVKTAFYRCSMKWHPDRNPGLNEAHKQFLKINEAYSVLGNEQKRRAYDRSLQIRTTSSGPHRSHSTAFSSSGEYSAARPTPGWQTGSSAAGGYRRPESSYARSSAGHGPRARSNFAEWERQHYQAMKARAEEIDREAKRSGVTANYTDFQVSVFQFLELLVVFGFVFCTAWAMSGLVRTRSERTGSSHKHSHSDE